MGGLRTVGAWLLLSAVYFVLFALGGWLWAPSLPEASPAPAGSAELGLLAMALVDSALVLGVVRTSRLFGFRLMLLVAGLFWGIKTFTSQIEAAYFMPNVQSGMLPGLLLMTVPVTLGVAVLGVALGGKLKRGQLAEQPAWQSPQLSSKETWTKVVLLACLVYPALFFAAGWFIAFSSEELRAFYGQPEGGTFWAHISALLVREPQLYLLESARGLLWVAFAIPLLRTTAGPRWVGGLHVVLWFAVLQNDVHWVPNPFMSPTIRLYHFIETASSNLVWGALVSWWMSVPIQQHWSRLIMPRKGRKIARALL
jgi:hypothetical protein